MDVLLDDNYKYISLYLWAGVHFVFVYNFPVEVILLKLNLVSMIYLIDAIVICKK